MDVADRSFNLKSEIKFRNRSRPRARPRHGLLPREGGRLLRDWFGRLVLRPETPRILEDEGRRRARGRTFQLRDLD